MPNKINNNTVLTVTEAAEFLNITRDAILKAIVNRNALPAEKIGPIWTIKLKDLEYYKKYHKGKVGKKKTKQMELNF